MPKRKRTSFLFVNKFKSFAVPCDGLFSLTVQEKQTA